MHNRLGEPVNDETVTVVMTCLHTKVFRRPAPRPGEQVWCERCDTYKGAIVPPDHFRVICLDCTKLPGTRDYGRARLTAEVDADKHARKKPGHRVRVLNGTAVQSERMHHAPPSLLDVPPY